jgi:hypothetical protein
MLELRLLVSPDHVLNCKLAQIELPSSVNDLLLRWLMKDYPGELTGLAADPVGFLQRSRSGTLTSVDGAVDKRGRIIRSFESAVASLSSS